MNAGKILGVVSLILLLALAGCFPSAPSPAPTAPASRATIVAAATLTALPAATVTAVPSTSTVAPTAQPTATVAPTATTAPTVTTAPTATTRPTATVQPSATATNTPRPTATPTTPARTMVITAPGINSTAASPITVRGRVSISPFESTLRGRVYDAQRRVVGEAPIMVDATMGQPGNFSGQIPYSVTAGGAGRVEVAELSARDGSVIIAASVPVVLVAPQSGAIQLPAANARLTLPLHMLVRVGQPGQQVIAILRWANGVELRRPFTLVQGDDDRGLLIGNLDWDTESQPPQPAARGATFIVTTASGAELARQPVQVLRWDDPDTQEIALYWVTGDQLQRQTRRIPRTTAVATAALTELLWGPSPGNLAGFTTAIPTPEQVLSFAGRGSNWGPRVTLKSVVINAGTATADFSREMEAYGGGSLRVKLITDQITRTLMQFSTIQRVRIAIEGQTEGVLQP